MKKIELLSPAGNYEALVAAVESGADAVYLGGNKFNARAYADNFTESELIKAVDYCHLKGVNVFVTLNVLIHDAEMESLIDYIDFLYRNDVDALIIQDVAVLKLVKELYSDFKLHCSTQMTIHDVMGAQLLEELGAKRIVLARELSINQIQNIVKNTNVEIEVFAHGALCVCYSGQCLMSSFIGGRSGNRGTCAQPCRKRYSLFDIDNCSIINKHKNKYLISTKDLNTYRNLKSIIDAGVSSIKIEGRMKKPEYVAVVVKHYKDAIDNIYQGNLNYIDKQAEYELESIFNRGFTKGYIFEKDNRNIINIERPSNRGIYLGKVLNQDGKNVLIKVDNGFLNDGDGIEIIGKKGTGVGNIVNGIKSKGINVKSVKQGDVFNTYIQHKVNIGDLVYKTFDNLLNSKIKDEYYYKDKIKIPLYGKIEAKIGHKPIFVVWDKDGNTVRYEGEALIEKAVKSNVKKEKLMEQMMKTGNTPFYFENINIEMDNEIYMPLSLINSLRRQALEAIMKKRQKRNKRHNIEVFSSTFLKNIYKVGTKIHSRTLIAGIKDFISAESAIKSGADCIYVLEYKDMKQIEAICHKNNVDVYCVLPNILKDNEVQDIKELLRDCELNGVIVSNIGQLKLAKELNYKFIRGNFTLNVFNSISLNYLADMGLHGICLSTELNMNEIKYISQNSNIEIECIVYGKIPIMTMEYCPVSVVCEKTSCSGVCKRRNYGLIDSKNEIFPIINTTSRRIKVLNSHVLFLVEYLEKLYDNGVDRFRMDFYNESPEEISKIVDLYKNYYRNSNEYDFLIRKIKSKGYTKGHYFRGI